LGKRLGNDLFCVEWDVKPQLNQSINQSANLDVDDASSFNDPPAQVVQVLLAFAADVDLQRYTP